VWRDGSQEASRVASAMGRDQFPSKARAVYPGSFSGGGDSTLRLELPERRGSSHKLNLHGRNSPWVKVQLTSSILLPRYHCCAAAHVVVSLRAAFRVEDIPPGQRRGSSHKLNLHGRHLHGSKFILLFRWRIFHLGKGAGVVTS
jgi:hypothetical protein